MPDPIVYRSTHPDVLAHWDTTASAQAQAKWRARVKETVADLGFEGRKAVITKTLLGDTVTGVEHPAGASIPTGWRRHRSMDRAIAPHKGTKTGKAAAEQLAALALPNPRVGMPGGMPRIADAAVGHAFLTPGVHRIGDVVYVRWTQQISERDAARIDGAVWDRTPLSEYYAAVESVAAEVHECEVPQ